jgi:putative transposase
MPYAYRKLSPEERKAILNYRETHGHTLHAPPHPYQVAGCYLVTAANFEHVPLMADDKRRTDFEARLLLGLKEAGTEVLAWVILPNHYHLLVQTETLLKVARVLKLLHGRTSREWNLADGQTGRRRAWYHYSDRRIRDEAHRARALNYVHYNPVKHGYASTAYDWTCSSVHTYLDEHGRDWLREQWRRHPPGAFGKGWDD